MSRFFYKSFCTSGVGDPVVIQTNWCFSPGLPFQIRGSTRAVGGISSEKLDVTLGSFKDSAKISKLFYIFALDNYFLVFGAIKGDVRRKKF